MSSTFGEVLARIEALLTQLAGNGSVEATAKSVKSLEERVAKVEKSASRGPVRTAVKAASAPNVVDAKAAKAAEYRAKASAANDPKLIEGYLLLAADAEK